MNELDFDKVLQRQMKPTFEPSVSKQEYHVSTNFLDYNSKTHTIYK